MTEKEGQVLARYQRWTWWIVQRAYYMWASSPETLESGRECMGTEGEWRDPSQSVPCESRTKAPGRKRQTEVVKMFSREFHGGIASIKITSASDARWINCSLWYGGVLRGIMSPSPLYRTSCLIKGDDIQRWSLISLRRIETDSTLYRLIGTAPLNL